MSLSDIICLARLQECAAFPHLAATFMREVAACHFLVVLAWTTCSRSCATPRMSRGDEARIRQRRLNKSIFYCSGWSGHNLRNNLSLAHLRSAPCLCTQASPRRWAARAGAGMSLSDIICPARLQECAAFPHLAATFMREVAECHLLVVLARTTCSRSCATPRDMGASAGLRRFFCNRLPPS